MEFRVFMCRIMESTNKSTSTSSFPVCISFICLIALSSSRIMLNRSGNSGHSHLVPDISGDVLSFSSFRMMLAVELYIAFIMLSYIYCIPIFAKTFIMKGFWILSKTFSVSNEMIMCFLSLSLFMWWITFIICIC